MISAQQAWDVISRGRFEIRHGGHRWTIEVDYFDLADTVALYRDGVPVRRERSPARFELGSEAAIEARSACWGCGGRCWSGSGGRRG